ncbi:50S ribosomal protein L22 [Candidatus Kaiserbacteria bacterium]|nr:MAG: 50S ribosomal protein L22 [Candidatus Kaiserbacteria bacterium]PCI89564.1 MAG: 50S ribosomal protein L22 [Candidatus Kaiserbacteria bacterium]
MKAFLKNYTQSPRKVRLVADLIRGKDAQHARAVLSFMDKKAAPALKKLLESALANAEYAKKSTENLIVKEIRVDSAGGALRRFRPRAFGRAAPFRRHSSKVTLQLGEKE